MRYINRRGRATRRFYRLAYTVFFAVILVCAIIALAHS